mgnify:CR=1 FL=1
MANNTEKPTGMVCPKISLNYILAVLILYSIFSQDNWSIILGFEINFSPKNFLFF